MPERGRIGIFNRSYYEEVLIVRVHTGLLANERIPKALLKGDVWKQRFADIRAYEDYLSRNGVEIRKFSLNVWRKEQRKRLLVRLDRPDKNWKFNAQDVHEREYWDDYLYAYEEMVRHTSTPESPWYVVPADKKWFTRLVVQMPSSKRSIHWTWTTRRSKPQSASRRSRRGRSSKLKTASAHARRAARRVSWPPPSGAHIDLRPRVLEGCRQAAALEEKRLCTESS